MKKSIIGIAGLVIFLIGCGEIRVIPLPAPTPVLELAWTVSPLPSPTETATVISTPSSTETPTAAPAETPLPAFTATVPPTLEPQWSVRGSGEVIVPILLYHHVAVPQSENIYYISPYAFEQQMNLLHEWGYRTISVELLVKAIHEGAELPAKPVIITFDDGGKSVYTSALPIMQKYSFTGAAYIVHDYVGTPGYMDAEQIRALYAAGWEIGSHSLSHADLTEGSDRQRQEIVESRRKLQALLGVPILSFSYPFGAYNEDSVVHARYAGYIAALGLGREALQGDKNLFYLYRQAVDGTDDLSAFASLLPWREDLENLPAITVVP
ncbi:MAG TPA: polysaccharide deacetylase family protein [Anaerolineales bacterium]|nr:polysaccharide deacetylase family protein [Anaerolineales bacterium]